MTFAYDKDLFDQYKGTLIIYFEAYCCKTIGTCTRPGFPRLTVQGHLFYNK